MKQVSLIVILAALVACSTQGKLKKSAEPISPESVAQFRLETTSESNVRSIMGLPVQTFESTDGQWKILTYCKGFPGFEPSVSFEFNNVSHQLRSVTYGVGSDQGWTVEDAKRYFPESNFTKREINRQVADWLYVETYFEDSSRGYRINMSDHRPKEVTSFTRSSIVQIFSSLNPKLTWRIVENRLPAYVPKP